MEGARADRLHEAGRSIEEHDGPGAAARDDDDFDGNPFEPDRSGQARESPTEADQTRCHEKARCHEEARRQEEACWQEDIHGQEKACRHEQDEVRGQKTGGPEETGGQTQAPRDEAPLKLNTESGRLRR